MTEKREYTKIKSVNKLLDILDFYARDGMEAGLSELSRELNLNKSTVHRILCCLEGRGYMVRRREDNRYKLGWKFINLGERVLDRLTIQEEADPIMQKLSYKTNKTAHLAVMHNYEAMYIHKVENPTSTVSYSRIGKTAPLYCTAMGKILLSSLDESTFNEYANQVYFTKKTKNTIKSKDMLNEEINKVKRIGYAEDNEELEVGLRCISVPIVNHRNKTVAALSVSGMVSSFEDKDCIVEQLIIGSKEISRNLGHWE